MKRTKPRSETTTKLRQRIRRAGWTLVRTTGKHEIWERDGERKTFYRAGTHNHGGGLLSAQYKDFGLHEEEAAVAVTGIPTKRGDPPKQGTLGRAIYDARYEKGWTLDKVASLVGVSSNETVRTWERNHRMPSKEQIAKLANALDWPESVRFKFGLRQTDLHPNRNEDKVADIRLEPVTEVTPVQAVAIDPTDLDASAVKGFIDYMDMSVHMAEAALAAAKEKLASFEGVNIEELKLKADAYDRMINAGRIEATS